MRYTIHITHTTLGVRVEVPLKPVERAILSWAQENMHAPKLGRGERGKVTVEQGDAYYVHIPTLRTFIFHKDFEGKLLNIIHNAVAEYRLDAVVQHHHVDKDRPAPVSCEFKPLGVPMVVTDTESRFYFQNEVVEAACEDGRQQTIFAIQTGSGKSLMCEKVIVRKAVRSALIHRPSYVDKWKFDICTDEKGLRLDESEVHVCQGVQGIYDAYEMGKSGELDRLGIKVIILPTVSLQKFLKEWMSTAHSNPVDIEKFYDVLGVGFVSYDEVHEHFHLVYLSGVMMNPPPMVEMSATLEPGKSKAFIADRYLERFPMSARLTIPYRPVVDVRGLYYDIADKRLPRYAQSMALYNHKLFEKKLIEYGLHESYAEMAFDLLEKTYLKHYQPGQKATFLFATIDMCKFMTEYLQERLAATEWHFLGVCKYNGGDSYDDFMMSDIGVSSPSKAGTAIDIKGLVHFYVYTPIDDQQLNIQIAGRPRVLTEWDMDPKVWFMHCMNIPKHCNYLNSRKLSLKGIAKDFQIAITPYVVRSTNVTTAAAQRAASTVQRSNLSKFSRKGASRKRGPGRRRR